jgi:hypothetical protein
LGVEPRDRLGNLAAIGAAGIAWLLVGLVVTTRDPQLDPVAGLVGAGFLGLALGLTALPLFWLAVFGRHRRIAYRGDWLRATRRGTWVGIVVALMVALRVEGAFSLPIAVFVIVLVLFLELTLTVER